jgi:ATP-dependent DNA helicase RecG
MCQDHEEESCPDQRWSSLFGHDPQQHIIQSEVVCVLYRDASVVGWYADRKIITGTIQELIDETEAFLSQHIPVGGRIEGWKRIDLPDYPLEALREAVVNAVPYDA